jgi:hypothetical protein
MTITYAIFIQRAKMVQKSTSNVKHETFITADVLQTVTYILKYNNKNNKQTNRS